MRIQKLWSAAADRWSGVAYRVALMVGLASLGACSLLAPSDSELLGGEGGDDAGYGGLSGAGGSAGAPGGTGSTTTGGVGGTATGGVGGAAAGGAGGAATGGSAGASSGGAAGVAGGSGGSAGGENCTDSVDNDNDNLVDCSDPDCQAAGYKCIPELPSGWSTLSVYATGSKPAPCGGDYSSTQFDGGQSVSAAPASCSSCSCAPAKGQVCNKSNIQIKYYSSATSCSTATSWFFQVSPGCNELTLPHSGGAKPRSARLTFLSAASGGGCAPQGGTPTRPAVTWSGAERVCQAPKLGAGCGTGTVCAPPPPSSFQAKYCTAKLGSHACPSSYSNKHTLYTSVNDTRGCTTCSCGSPSPGTCTGVFEDHLGSGCGGKATKFTTTCTPVPESSASGSEVRSVSVSGIVGGGGTCPPSSTSPSGSVTKSGLATVCCQ